MQCKSSLNVIFGKLILWGGGTKRSINMTMLGKCIKNVNYFPAFSRSGREMLLPAQISRSSFPVRELRSLRTIVVPHLGSKQISLQPRATSNRGHLISNDFLSGPKV